MMDEPEQRISPPDLLDEEEEAGNRFVSLLLLSAVTVTMAAWIVFLGWAAWSLLSKS